jgi:hypothetical protein
MRSRDDYDAALHIVGEVVRSWDPYSLISSGAPTNEFDSEIAQVVTLVPDISSPSAAAAALSSVFSAAFEPELFSPTQCSAPGQELFAKLAAAGLVPQA